jgi:multiple sugar transport system substrate-binding protein
MTEPVTLKGMTWDHARGFDPMVATSKAYGARHPGVEIVWEKRSLQAFADRPIKDMAADYDLMVIDHPHVGEVAPGGWLVALDTVGRPDELAALARQSVGKSHPSYQFDGHQWALAIDAATPVAAYRPDRISAAPDTWDEVLEMARSGQVAFALIPVNALTTFFGMANSLGYSVAETPHRLLGRAAGEQVLASMMEICALMDPACLDLDPIDILDAMSGNADAPAYAPFGYGYTNYSRARYRPYPIVFADAPAIGSRGPAGTVLGGTGISVSARSKHPDIAVDYAFFIAGADCQSGLYFSSGGQPANAVAWESSACNASCANFFTNTRKTLETAWVRPRYHGYMGFQDRAGRLIHACLRRQTGIAATLDALEAAYGESRS